MSALWKVLASALLGSLLLTAGCGGGGGSASPAQPLAVSLYITTPDLTGGQTSSIGAHVDNDFSAGGVQWSLKGSGTLTYPPETFLSSAKLDCYYNAPSAVAEKFTVTVLATVARDVSKTASVTLTVYPNVTISKDPLPQAKAGTPYSYQLTGGGGRGGPLTFVLADLPLPPGLTLSRDGLLSGTPTVTGSYSLTIQAQDTTFTFPGSATNTYNLNVI